MINIGAFKSKNQLKSLLNEFRPNTKDRQETRP